MQIFKVYEGKIAVFPVPDEQIDPQTEAIEPIDVKILAIARKIGHHQELTAAGTVADGFHLGKVTQEVLAVVLADLFGLAADASQDLDAGNYVVTVKPCLEGILGTTKQNGTVTLLGKDAVEIVYPKRDAAPGEEG